MTPEQIIRQVASGSFFAYEPDQFNKKGKKVYSGQKISRVVLEQALDALMGDISDWPLHQPECSDAPIPGRQWYGGCNPDGGMIDPRTGCCTECGEVACWVCGKENCPDHPFNSGRGFNDRA